MKSTRLLKLIFTALVISLIYFYFSLPAINIQSFNFLFYFIFVISIIIILNIALENKTDLRLTGKELFKYFSWLIVVVLILLAGTVVFSTTFNSKLYANRITVTESNFNEDIEEVDLTNLPLLDKDSTRKVGDRVMGQIPELISQFYVSDLYTQVNYDGRLVRVTPLEYEGIIKWFGNSATGTPGYIKVDSTTGEATLVQLEEGMKYMPSGHFFTNLYRHIRIQYPTAIFGNSKFEIDDEGKPFWITPVKKYTWVGLLEDSKGVVITDPVTGDSDYYAVEDVPNWVDHVYQATLVMEQTNDWGLFQDGWLNSFISQKNVRKTTSGYTYLADSNDIYVYTGITSALADESNIGFILINLRTKETKYYGVPGAEEYSAMASAQGAIQEKSYISTFPLLINLNDKPTYLVSLKDSAGLVKAYAFVDVQDYQKVKVTNSDEGLKAAATAYLKILGVTQDNVQLGEELSGIVESIENVVVDGNTYFYIKLVNDDSIYKVKVTINDILPFMKIDDSVKFFKLDNEITSIK
jgi:hypothetical protein